MAIDDNTYKAWITKPQQEMAAEMRHRALGVMQAPSAISAAMIARGFTNQMSDSEPSNIDVRGGSKNMRSFDLARLLLDRLRLKASPVQACTIWVGDEKTYVWYVKDNVPAQLEDETGLFPSDTLVAALRMAWGL